MSGLRAFSAGFLHRGNTFLPFPPRFYDFPSPQRVETPSSEEREEIRNLDRPERKQAPRQLFISFKFTLTER